MMDELVDCTYIVMSIINSKKTIGMPDLFTLTGGKVPVDAM